MEIIISDAGDEQEGMYIIKTIDMNKNIIVIWP